MAVLQVNHLAKSFSGKPVLRDISMSVEKGEVIAIIGPSGSGKTTFLRCAAMLETMDAGDLLFSDLAAVRGGVYAEKKDLQITSYLHLNHIFASF